MTLPRLLILSFSDIAADARVLKQVEHLADRYDVTTYGYGQSPHPHVRHVELDQVHRLRAWTRQELLLRRFRHMYWGQPAIQHARADLEAMERFDVILANDIDAVGLALALKPTRGVHADIHEYAPRQNEEDLIWRVFIGPFARWMCAKFLPKTSSMTTVGQGIAAEYHKVYGVQPGVVTNATPFADLTPAPASYPIKLVHSGASLRNRRLEVLVDAVRATRSDVTLDLYLMGNDPAYVAELRERASGLDRIRFREPVPYRDLIATLNAYDIGIHVIAPTNFNNTWALPNKFFDYVQARLAVIIGPSPEMQRLLEGARVGAVSTGFDAEALTRVLDSLTVAHVDQWKTNSHSAAHDLSSESQVEVWGAAIDALMNRSGS